MSLSLSPRPSLSRQGNVVEDMEKKTCKLEPKLEGRIVVIHNKEVCLCSVNLQISCLELLKLIQMTENIMLILVK